MFALLAVIGVSIFVALAFFVNKAVNTVNDNLAAQAKVEKETGISSSPLGFNVKHPPQRDISSADMTCSTDSAGEMRAAGNVVNHSSKTSVYSIAVSFMSNGTEVGTGVDVLPGVDPGKTAPWSAVSTAPASGTFVCKIVAIYRWDLGTIAPPTSR